jgi:phosphate transport system substrate-binding protein
VKLQRSGIIAGIALTATLGLAACGSDNTTPTTSASVADCAGGSLTAAG